jgi:hypothetical protein
MALHPGSLVSLCDNPHSTYQVVNVDTGSNHVWVRRWPLTRHRNCTFGLSCSAVRPISASPIHPG